MASPTQLVQGTVQAVNARGVKVGGAWFNFSKFVEVVPPQRGAEVELEVQAGTWIRAVRARPPQTGGRSADVRGATDEWRAQVEAGWSG